MLLHVHGGTNEQVLDVIVRPPQPEKGVRRL